MPSPTPPSSSTAVGFQRPLQPPQSNCGRSRPVNGQVQKARGAGACYSPASVSGTCQAPCAAGGCIKKGGGGRRANGRAAGAAPQQAWGGARMVGARRACVLGAGPCGQLQGAVSAGGQTRFQEGGRRDMQCAPTPGAPPGKGRAPALGGAHFAGCSAVGERPDERPCPVEGSGAGRCPNHARGRAGEARSRGRCEAVRASQWRSSMPGAARCQKSWVAGSS
jgi:hypothetical protein